MGWDQSQIPTTRLPKPAPMTKALLRNVQKEIPKGLSPTLADRLLAGGLVGLGWAGLGWAGCHHACLSGADFGACRRLVERTTGKKKISYPFLALVHSAPSAGWGVSGWVA